MSSDNVSKMRGHYDHFWPHLRLFILRHSLRILNFISKRFTRRDQALPHLVQGQCGRTPFLLGKSVSHPSPIWGLNFSHLFESAAAHVSPNALVLEVGAGAGIWSLLCLERGALVTASDLADVDLSGLQEMAKRRHSPIDIRYGDLFEAIHGQHFHHIFFNPPFHQGEATKTGDQAYFGGGNGQVVRRFLKQLPHRLHSNGIAWIILPEREQEQYTSELSEWLCTTVRQQWFPLLGRVSLLALRSPSSSTPPPQTRPMNAVSECFLQLSRTMNTHSCECLTVQGRIDQQILTSAITLVLDQNLLTRSTLNKVDYPHKLSLKGWRWVSQHPTPPPKVRVSTLSDEEQESLQQSISSEGHWESRLPSVILDRIWQREALDPTQSPAFEFHLLNGQQWSFLLIISPHLCTDAFAGTHLMNQIAKVYTHLHSTSKEQSIVDQSVPHTMDLAASKESNFEHVRPSYQQPNPLSTGLLKGSLSQRVIQSTQALTEIILDLALPGGGLPTTRAHKTQRGATQVQIKRVSAAHLQTVLSGARRRNVKAHTLFTWGLAQAMIQWSKKYQQQLGSHVRFADLCTLRPLINPEFAEDVDILIQPYTHSLNLSWNENEALNRISTQLERQKHNHVIVDLFRSRVYRLFTRIFPLPWVMKFTFSTLFKTNITTTNPGRAPLRFEHFGEAKVVEFLNFPQIAPPAEIGFVYTTYQGELRLLTIYDESRWTDLEIQELTEGLWAQVIRLATIQ